MHTDWLTNQHPFETSEEDLTLPVPEAVFDIVYFKRNPKGGFLSSIFLRKLTERKEYTAYGMQHTLSKVQLS